ncbi:MAG: hypothetical protein HYT62_02145 [Candidatus Yanofskybacteria bacterium]|nr:hypothetical protein [Candidatus Yanofskybacteria bacterium]
MQSLKGNFNITFYGIPLLFVSKSVLTSEKGSRATVYSVHITPLFAFGVTFKNKKEV